MRLHGVFDGRVYASAYRRVLLEGHGGALEPVGRLPVPDGANSLGYRLRTTWPWKAAVEGVTGRFPSVTLHRITENDLLATAGRWVFTSNDAGRSWHHRHDLPASSGPMGVLPSGVCVHDGSVYLGEYPLAGEAKPRILRSPDRGRSWTAEHTLDDVRHVHAVQVDPYTNDLWVTTGDADDECRLLRRRGGELEVIGEGSQRWRAVELAFTPTAVLWGVDCGYAETNRIYRLDRTALDGEGPKPTAVGEVDDSVFYAVSLPIGDRHWVAVSTAAEPMADSTGPAERVADAGDDGSVAVVAAADDTGYTEWVELARYDRRRSPTDRVNLGGRLPIAGAYAFLAADPVRGLFVNPMNTADDDGRIRRYSPSAIERRGGYR